MDPRCIYSLWRTPFGSKWTGSLWRAHTKQVDDWGYALWVGPTLEQFVKVYIPQQGHLAEAGEEVRRNKWWGEDAMDWPGPPFPLPLHCQGTGRDPGVGNEGVRLSLGRRELGEAFLKLTLFLTVLLCFYLTINYFNNLLQTKSAFSVMEICNCLSLPTPMFSVIIFTLSCWRESEWASGWEFGSEPSLPNHVFLCLWSG